MIAAKEFQGKLMQIIFGSTNKQTNETTIHGFTVVKFLGTTSCKYYTEQVQIYTFSNILRVGSLPGQEKPANVRSYK